MQLKRQCHAAKNSSRPCNSRPCSSRMKHVQLKAMQQNAVQLSAAMGKINLLTTMPTKICNPHWQHASRYQLHTRAPSGLLTHKGHVQRARDPGKQENPSLHVARFAKATACACETINDLTRVSVGSRVSDVLCANRRLCPKSQKAPLDFCK